MTDDIDPDSVPEADMPKLSREEILGLAEVDLAIEEILRELDECVDDWVDTIDRTLVIHLIRMAYIQGYEDRHMELTAE